MQFLVKFCLLVLVRNAILFQDVQQVDRTCIRGPKHLVYFIRLSFQALYQLNRSFAHFPGLLLLIIKHKLDWISSCLIPKVMLIIFEPFSAPDQKERARCIVELCRIQIHGFGGVTLIATHSQHLRCVLSLIDILTAIVGWWRWIHSLEIARRDQFRVLAQLLHALLLHLNENLGLLMLDLLFMPFKLNALAHTVIICDY